MLSATEHKITTSQIGKSREKGNSRNILNCAVTRHATIIPIIIPRIPAETITKKASYIKILLPSAFVTPIDLSTPYSQMLSLMFYVVATKSKKNVKMREITPMIPTMNVKTKLTDLRESIIETTSTIIG